MPNPTIANPGSMPNTIIISSKGIYIIHCNTVSRVAQAGKRIPNTVERPDFCPGVSLSKKCKCVRSRARASQSSVVRRRRKEVKSVFSGDMCVGKNTAQPASVRAKRVRRSGLQPFEHVLARAREPVDFVDRLKMDLPQNLCFAAGPFVNHPLTGWRPGSLCRRRRAGPPPSGRSPCRP